jgi:ribosomal protein S3
MPPRPDRHEHSKAQLQSKEVPPHLEAKVLAARSAHNISLGRQTSLRRVVKIVKSPCKADGARVFISGRMADVCAELERLAAKEAMGLRHF